MNKNILVFKIQTVNLDSSFVLQVLICKMRIKGFPGGAVVENPPADAGDAGSGPGPGGSHMPRSN